MNSTLIQMTILMACGAAWRVAAPAGLGADQTRLVLTTLVYYLLLPAMVLDVLWTADIGVQSLQYSLLGVASIAVALAVMAGVGALCRFTPGRMGAMMLAAAFPNVTYLGLPVLQQTFGDWSRSVVIQLDLFAASPFLFTVGIMLARHYGEADEPSPKPAWTFLNAPPFWAAAVAIMLNQNGIVAPDWLSGTLRQLSATVAPLMLFALGLALSWRAVTLRNLPYALPVVAIKMLAMPVFSLWLASYLALDAQHKAAAVLDMAMPSMVLGIVFCDRYRLDSALYAMIVTVTTALSLVTLPLWHDALIHAGR